MNKSIVGIIIAYAVCGNAYGQYGTFPGESGVYVEVYNAQNDTWSNASSSHPNRYALPPEPGYTEFDTINLSTVAGKYYAIFAVIPSITDIDEIVINGDGNVIVGRNAFGSPATSFLSPTTNPGIAGCRNLDTLRTPSSDAIVKAYISGNIETFFAARRIIRLKCHNIRGQIISNPNNDIGAPASGRVECDNIFSPGSVTSQMVQLGVVDVSGNVTGVVRAVGGANLPNCIIGGTLSGAVEAADNGFFGVCDIGSVSSSGTITASRDMGFCLIHSSMNGLVDVDGDFDNYEVGGNSGGTVDVEGSILFEAKVGTLDGGAITVGGDIEKFTFTGNAFGGSISTGGELKELQVEGSWGANGSFQNYAPMTLSVPQNKLDLIHVVGDFVGDLAGYTLEHFFVDGNIYDYDTELAQVTTSDVTTSSNIKRFAAVGYPPSPLGQDESLLNLTAPTVGAFFVGNRLKEGLINLTNGVGEVFVNKGGLTVPAAFRLGEGLGSEAHLHFGYDIADPQRQGLKSKWAYLNHGIAGDSWDGEVSVGLGPTDLNRLILTENYTTLSDSIGGGAFGNSPFNFHQREEAPPAGENRDCNPYQLEVVDVGRSEELRSVVISHYGPVYVVTENTDPIALCDEIDTGPHFRVEFLPWMDVNPAWVDRTSLFEVDLCETSYDDPITLSRTVKLVAKDNNAKGFKAAGTWRIRPLAGRVKSGGYYNPDVEYDSSVVSGDLGGAGDYSWYQFDVRLVLQPGVFALDSGNGVQASDLSQWIDTPYETNADGETDSQDFIDMAEQYTGN